MSLSALAKRFSEDVPIQELKYPTFGQHGQPAITEFRAFMKRIYFYDLPKGFYIQIVFACVVMGLIIVCGALLVGRRIYERSFWLFRVQQRPKGLVVIPNAITIFVVVEGCFALVWLLYATIHVSRQRTESSPRGMILWLALTWVPLFWGAFWGGWGTHYASPDSASTRYHNHHEEDEESGWSFERLRPRPWMLNFFCLFAPVLNFISVLVPAIPGDQKFNRSYEQWLALDGRLASFENQGNPGPIPTHLLDEGKQIWKEAVDGLWFLEICFIIWTIWAFLFLIFYVTSGGVLMIGLVKQLLELKELKETKFFGGPPVQCVDALVQHQQGVVTQGSGSGASGASGAVLETSFFPPVRSKKAEPLSVGENGTAALKFKMMKKICWLVGLQYMAISAGTMGFLALVLYLSSRMYAMAVEQGTIKAAYNSANLVAAWLAVAFGSITFLAAAAKTFEPLILQLHLSAARKDKRRATTQNGQTKASASEQQHEGFSGPSRSSNRRSTMTTEIVALESLGSPTMREMDEKPGPSKMGDIFRSLSTSRSTRKLLREEGDAEFEKSTSGHSWRESLSTQEAAQASRSGDEAKVGRVVSSSRGGRGMIGGPSSQRSLTQEALLRSSDGRPTFTERMIQSKRAAGAADDGLGTPYGLFPELNARGQPLDGHELSPEPFSQGSRVETRVRHDETRMDRATLEGYYASSTASASEASVLDPVMTPKMHSSAAATSSSSRDHRRSLVTGMGLAHELERTPKQQDFTRFLPASQVAPPPPGGPFHQLTRSRSGRSGRSERSIRFEGSDGGGRQSLSLMSDMESGKVATRRRGVSDDGSTISTSPVSGFRTMASDSDSRLSRLHFDEDPDDLRDAEEAAARESGESFIDDDWLADMRFPSGSRRSSESV
ncbi:hypothetical protein IE53DRAFT_408957 [Violaceomyces palustris]|uniref:Uncharacterized protein n=1 Tax=Violaceomyces palustris TaxID=1673888 RepID=A0ACD0P4S7_9BASI|nr:hypothetical protein IE53DRAFT_408957 [Violaceomyces palustris]